MAFKTKRLLKKIVSWSGLFFFVVAAYMIYHQLSKYKLEDIKDALVSIPAHNLFFSLHGLARRLCRLVLL